jgi:hypothetical protein
MAALSGTRGSITFPNAITGALATLSFRWTAEFDRAVHDVTPFSPDGNARVHIPDVHMIRGTCEGYLDDTVPFQMTPFQAVADVPGNFTLAYGSRQYTFAGLLSNFSPSAEVGQPARWTASFVSSGTITAT